MNRTALRTLVLAAGLALPASALAQPAATDLGTLTMDGTPINVPAFDIAANAVVWYKFTLNTPVRYQDLKYLNILTLGAQDTEVSLWDPSGNFIRSDDDDGPGLASMLTFGTGDGTIQPTGTVTADNGRDGDLLPTGVYYIGVTYFNVTWGTTNWTVTTPGNTALTGVTFRVNGGNTPAVTQPANTIDLGTLPASGTITNSAAALSATNRVQWYKVVIPGGISASNTFVDMDTEGTLLAPSNTTRLTLFTVAGAQAARTDGTGITNFTDLTDGSNSLSALSFGVATPNRPAVGNGLAYNGRDGDIRPGTYYLNVMGTGSTPTSTSTTLSVNFGITSTSTNYGPVTVNLNSAFPSAPPSGTGSVSPLFGQVSDNFNVFVTALPGQGPLSPVSSVTVNTGGVDAGTLVLHNDGLPPDVSGADNIWSGTGTVGAAAISGANTMVATISDSELTPRTGTANINFTVVGAPPACPSGDESFSFTNLNSDGTVGNVANGVTTFNPTGSGVVTTLRITGRYAANNAFSAETRIRVTAPNGKFVDVQPFTTSAAAGVPVDYTSADIALPCPVAGNAGAWEVRVYESVNDTGVDGNWGNLCVATVVGPQVGTQWTGDICIADAGELLATAQEPAGTGTLSTILGNFAASDVDMYKIRICDLGTFKASLVGGTTADTQMFLFNEDGTGKLFNDDNTGTPTFIRQSEITNVGGQITAVGNYYLAVGVYNRDPQNASNQLLWNNTDLDGGFDEIRIPDGPGAATALASWVNTTSTTGNYTLALTGVCYTTVPNPACNIADITEIGGTEEAPGTPDGQLTVDDLILFVNLFSSGAGCPGTAPCNRADVTGVGGLPAAPDGDLTVDDLIEFVNAFSEGCPV